MKNLIMITDPISCSQIFKIKQLSSRKGLHTSPVVPAVVYSNPDVDKERVIKENRGKSGIYRWTNLISGKTYIGSSVNLGRRLRDYYNYSFLTHPHNSRMAIYKALLKYGYSNFSLDILEYCDGESSIIREQYYIDLLEPKYNLLTKAGSSLGYRHTGEGLIKLRDHLTNLNEKKGIQVEVTDLETKAVTTYGSIRKAAEALSSDGKAIRYNERSTKPFKGRYIIKILRR